MLVLEDSTKLSVVPLMKLSVCPQGPTWNGRSGVHTHMTNTRITDPEILEQRYYAWAQ